MKYMLMICDDESVTLSPAEVHALPQIQAWDAEVDARGIRRGGARLRPSSDAATPPRHRSPAYEDVTARPQVLRRCLGPAAIALVAIVIGGKWLVPRS